MSEKIGQLKMKSLKDGKMYNTDTLDTTGIFRLIESVPSPKAEPFKVWLANLGKERIDEVFYLKNVTAKICSFTEETKEISF